MPSAFSKSSLCCSFSAGGFVSRCEGRDRRHSFRAQSRNTELSREIESGNHWRKKSSKCPAVHSYASLVQAHPFLCRRPNFSAFCVLPFAGNLCWQPLLATRASCVSLCRSCSEHGHFIECRKVSRRHFSGSWPMLRMQVHESMPRCVTSSQPRQVNVSYALITCPPKLTTVMALGNKWWLCTTAWRPQSLKACKP